MAHILLADDDEAARYTISYMLMAEGHEVVEAGNGTQALRTAAEHTFDLAIIDILMPEKDGLEVIMELKKRRQDTPILAISGGGRAQFADLARMSTMLGAKDFLTKPFDVDAIKEKLAALLPSNPASS